MKLTSKLFCKMNDKMWVLKTQLYGNQLKIYVYKSNVRWLLRLNIYLTYYRKISLNVDLIISLYEITSDGTVFFPDFNIKIYFRFVAFQFETPLWLHTSIHWTMLINYTMQTYIFRNNYVNVCNVMDFYYARWFAGVKFRISYPPATVCTYFLAILLHHINDSYQIGYLLELTTKPKAWLIYHPSSQLCSL